MGNQFYKRKFDFCRETLVDTSGHLINLADTDSLSLSVTVSIEVFYIKSLIGAIMKTTNGTVSYTVISSIVFYISEKFSNIKFLYLKVT